MTLASGTRHRAGAGVLILALVAGLAACGDDDGGDKATDTTDAAGGDGGGQASDASEEFCGAIVDFNTALFEIELEEAPAEADVIAAGETLAPLSTAVVESAPEDLTDTAQELDDSVQPLVEGDETAFNTEGTFAKYSDFVADAVDACAFNSVEVTGIDYAFEDVPETIDAGTTAFAFTNAAETEEHEMIVFRRADGVTEDFPALLELSEEESADKVQFVTVAFAPPGEEGTTLVELEPGDYAMVCFVPVGGAEGGAPHYTEGMLQEFVVE